MPSLQLSLRITRLAVRVAAELAEHGMIVQVANATRDVGVMFTAGLSRNTSLSSKRMAKATKRITRIAKIATSCRAARKLYTSGAFPQASWDTSVWA